MKNLILLLLLLGSLLAQAAPDPFYRQQIVADARFRQGAAERAVTDLKALLEKATGRTFTLRFANRPTDAGIQIFTSELFPLTAAERSALEKASPEACLVKEAGDRLILTATVGNSLPNAIYTYLDGVGFRWYFPGETWSIIPRLTNLHVSGSRVYLPAWRTRKFFGTGGFLPLPGLDPESKVPWMWEDWSMRNRFGAEVELRGHYGEWFNEQHRKELEAHPEYLAMVQGKRVPWSPGAKHCISNRALRTLYIGDRLKEAAQLIARRSYPGEMIALTVDPSDGGGHCECAECVKMGTVSDRVFFLANEVAKALKPLGPRVFANVYAYNAHAAPPRSPLADNLIVQIIPYAFQSYGTPVKFIEDWGKKSPALLIYDYYGVTDWHYNLPMSGRWSVDTLLNRFQFWTEKKFQGFNLESSYSIGGPGRGLYLAGRYGWQGRVNWKEEEDRFYDLFGAQQDVVRMYYRVLNSSFRGINDAVFLLHRLEQARQRSTGQVATRFLHLQAYLGYLIRYYGWKGAEGADAELRWTDLVKYVYKLHFTGLLQTSRVVEQLIWQSNLPKSVTDAWNPGLAEAGRFRELQPYTEQELVSSIRQDLIANPLLADFPYQPKSPLKYTLSRPVKMDTAGMLLLAFPKTMVFPGADKKIHFQFRVNTATTNNWRQKVQVRLIDTATGKIIFQQQIDLDYRWKSLAIPVATSQPYRLEITPENWIRFRVPEEQWIGFQDLPEYAVMGKLFFYIRPGDRYIYYAHKGTRKPVFSDEQGKPVRSEVVNKTGLLRLPVAASASGKWWSVEGMEYQSIQFFGQPDLFFMQPNYKIQ